MLGLFFISPNLSFRRNRRIWRGHMKSLANCLQMGASQQTNVSSNDLLRFIHHRHYMIVPQSNPPTPSQLRPALNSPNRNTRSVGAKAARTSYKCPFEYRVIDYKHTTVPRYLSEAFCKDCDSHCKPVMYTHKLLFRKCKNFWMWTQKTLAVAYAWVVDE